MQGSFPVPNEYDNDCTTSARVNINMKKLPAVTIFENSWLKGLLNHHKKTLFNILKITLYTLGMLISYLHTTLIAITNIFIDDHLKNTTSEGHRKLPMSAALYGEF